MVPLLRTREQVPLWRDDRVIKAVLQIAFIVALLLVLNYFWDNALRSLRQLGLTPSFRFLRTTAGFELAESIIPYSPTMSYVRAYLVGVVNTVRVALTGIALCTLLGLLIGVASLSPNWLLRTLARAYVELIRNTPLILQISFWYFGITFSLPRPQNAIELPGSIFLSNRGIAIPRFTPGPELPLFLGTVAAALVLAVLVYRHQVTVEVERGKARYPLSSALAVFLGLSVLGRLAVGGQAFVLSYPELGRFSFIGGLTLSPEFFALTFALIIYTAAFIAEIVRGAILSISRGQTEAGLAVGLSRMQLLRLVILPQALRIIVPPLTSQYLNLTKNSSLAIWIGYHDLWFVVAVTVNQAGRAIEMISIGMATYLTFSLLTALFMNWYNRRVRLVER